MLVQRTQAPLAEARVLGEDILALQAGHLEVPFVQRAHFFFLHTEGRAQGD